MKSRKKFSKQGNTFLESWKFLLSSKRFILAGIVFFFVSFILGFIISPSAEILEAIRKFIEETLLKTEGMSFFELAIFIFLNNLKVGFFGMILGVFFCFVPFLLAISNGYLVGFVALQSVYQNGIFSLWKLFPHGIFELPAIFISLGLGFRLGSFIFNKDKISFWKFLLNCLLTFCFFVVPLLIIAAIIESAFISF